MRYQRFILERYAGDVIGVTMPVPVAVAILLVLVPPHHHPLLCEFLGSVARTVPRKNALQAFQGSGFEDLGLQALDLWQQSHKGSPDIEIVLKDDELEFTMLPVELHALTTSMGVYMGSPISSISIVRETIECLVLADRALVKPMERFSSVIDPGTVIQ